MLFILLCLNNCANPKLTNSNSVFLDTSCVVDLHFNVTEC